MFESFYFQIEQIRFQIRTSMFEAVGVFYVSLKRKLGSWLAARFGFSEINKLCRGEQTRRQREQIITRGNEAVLRLIRSCFFSVRVLDSSGLLREGRMWQRAVNRRPGSRSNNS